MASAQTNPFLPNLYLSPEQEQQLLQALAAQQNGNANSLSPHPSSTLSVSPSSFSGSPQQRNLHGVQESPYLDNYDYSFGDSSIDFDTSDLTAQMIGDLPDSAKSDSADNDSGEKEKRAHPDDGEEEAAKGAKRRESTEKVPKKPGRKPLTSEPTSVRSDPSST
jgi:AP-1-like transcription factor